MKKLILTASCLVLGITTMMAQKYMTRTGKIFFNATTPKSPEKIEGINNEVANIIDAGSGVVVFQVLIKSFKFERELMQEHFNEDYMESDKYPKADFKGSISDAGGLNFAKDGTYNVKVKGNLTVHGVTKEITEPGTITVKGNTINVKSKFSVKLEDYKIIVPAMVADKVNKEATISLDGDLTLK